MYPRKMFVMLLAAALSVPGLQGQSAGNRAAARKLLQLEADFASATAQRGGDGFASFFANDAITLPAQGRILSGDASKDTMRWNPKDFELSWQPVKAEVAASGDLGYTYGYYQSVSHTTKGDVRREGKYTTIWRKQKNGEWKVVLDMGNEGSNHFKKP